MKEETYFRKLIADGEGTGEDRRVQQVAAFFRESRKAEEPKVAEVLKVTKALELIELSMMKQQQIAQMNKIQTAEFDACAEDIDKQIESMYKTMEEAKIELEEAKVVKKNRQEYRKLVNVLNEVPSRSETIRKLEEVKDDLERQHERQKILEAKLVDRRNHLQAFNIILSNFQRFCTEDDEDDAEIENEAEDDDDAASIAEKKEDDK
uniref:THO complex subunit 7 homolog n=1 Tax=Caenorhabditis tropicalis TaxID=1561998 RepID=A0A1I7UA31_9PELO